MSLGESDARENKALVFDDVIKGWPTLGRPNKKILLAFKEQVNIVVTCSTYAATLYVKSLESDVYVLAGWLAGWLAGLFVCASLLNHSNI